MLSDSARAGTDQVALAGEAFDHPPLCGHGSQAGDPRGVSRWSPNEDTRPARPDGCCSEAAEKPVETGRSAHFLNFSLASFEKRKTSFWLFGLAATLISLPNDMIVRAGLAGI